ncbi:MAG: hypothetical protein A2X59_00590 [Nitrospirae bacterium GWC2_42_7]|nr:MAG: hypothetical protein A2X59_00590 [Nitrospirae bacterium GWC2_42_7]
MLKNNEIKAISLYKELEDGIMQTIKAADIYAIHLTAIGRRKEPNQQQIVDIIMGNKISGLTVHGMFYTESEKNDFQAKGHLVNIGNQILLATYTAFEFYLINKFKEYLRYYSQDADNLKIEALFKKLSFRTLDNIKTLYKDILGIYLPQFEMRSFAIDPDSSFKPKSTWEGGIKIIEKARHEIAHKGKSINYKIRLLPDAWGPFDFVRRWVNLFDVNFDLLIYEGKTTQLIREYKKRVEACKEREKTKDT